MAMRRTLERCISRCRHRSHRKRGFCLSDPSDFLDDDDDLGDGEDWGHLGGGLIPQQASITGGGSLGATT